MARTLSTIVLARVNSKRAVPPARHEPRARCPWNHRRGERTRLSSGMETLVSRSVADRSAELSMAIPLVNAVLEVVGFYGQDAARGVTDNSLRHRSHQKGPQAGSSVGAHNHQVRLMLAGELDDS
jgi:hypothetical protein